LLDRPRMRRSVKPANSLTDIRFSRAAQCILRVSRRPARTVNANQSTGSEVASPKYGVGATEPESWEKTGFQNSGRIRSGIAKKVSPLYQFLTFSPSWGWIPHKFGTQQSWNQRNCRRSRRADSQLTEIAGMLLTRLHSVVTSQ